MWTYEKMVVMEFNICLKSNKKYENDGNTEMCIQIRLTNWHNPGL